MKTYPYRLDTIGKLVDEGMTLTAYCHAPGCGHSAGLDLVALAGRLGRDHSCGATALVPRLKCWECGKKEASLRLGHGLSRSYCYPSL